MSLQLDAPVRSVAVPARLRLAAEFGFLFVAVPLLFYLRVLPNFPIHGLVVTAVAVWVWLRRNPGFDALRLNNWAAARMGLPGVSARAAAIVLVMLGAVWVLRPDLLFSFIQRSPAGWAALMVIYPLLSVYPQEVIWRAFLFERYRSLFGSQLAVIGASALAFGFAHIVFGNWLAVVLSGAGGILFGLTYLRSRSLILVAFEHAVLGQAIFTIGLGDFFYHGARL